ncbi:hypothetical protein CHCC20375_1834 [Bacillus licheniformis]|nr:hypothetical protein CHCC20375_1834 [Bacillus licheniformis]
MIRFPDFSAHKHKSIMLKKHLILKKNSSLNLRQKQERERLKHK